MKKNNRRDFLKKTATVVVCASVAAIGLGGCRGKEQTKLKRPGENDPDFSRIAYCGIYCDTCPLYKATINNDDKAKMAVAEEWGMSGKSDFSLDEFYCYGCKDKRSLSNLVCYNCTVKECAVKKGVAVCSQCRNLESCDQKLWKDFPWIHDKAMRLRSEPGTL
jgi:hypothetical protein